MFSCTECGEKFKAKKNLNRHNLSSHQSTVFDCITCDKGFSRKDNLLRHARSHNTSTSTIPIHDTPLTKRSKPSLPEAPNATPSEDEEMCNLMDTLERGEPIITPCSSPFKNSLQPYRVAYMYPTVDPILFLNQMAPSMQNLVHDCLQTNTGVKLWVCLQVQYYKPTEPVCTTHAYHRTKQIAILRGDELSIKVSSGFPKILKSIEKFQAEGSAGWAIKWIFQADIHLSRYQPLRGNCYKPLPKKIQDKKAVINIQNKDDKCFLWLVLAHLHPIPHENNPQRLSNYTTYEDTLDTTGSVFSMEIKDIPSFERANHLSINVYGWEDLVYPLYTSEAPGRHIDLLYYEGHYCSLGILIASLVTNESTAIGNISAIAVSIHSTLPQS